MPPAKRTSNVSKLFCAVPAPVVTYCRQFAHNKPEVSLLNMLSCVLRPKDNEPKTTHTKPLSSFIANVVALKSPFLSHVFLTLCSTTQTFSEIFACTAILLAYCGDFMPPLDSLERAYVALRERNTYFKFKRCLKQRQDRKIM